MDGVGLFWAINFSRKRAPEFLDTSALEEVLHLPPTAVTRFGHGEFVVGAPDPIPAMCAPRFCGSPAIGQTPTMHRAKWGLRRSRNEIPGWHTSIPERNKMEMNVAPNTEKKKLALLTDDK